MRPGGRATIGRAATSTTTSTTTTTGARARAQAKEKASGAKEQARAKARASLCVARATAAQVRDVRRSPGRAVAHGMAMAVSGLGEMARARALARALTSPLA